MLLGLIKLYQLISIGYNKVRIMSHLLAHPLPLTSPNDLESGNEFKFKNRIKDKN